MKKIQPGYFIPVVIYIFAILIDNGVSRAFFTHLVIMLLLIGMAGSTVAAFYNCTTLAIVSGISILIFGIYFLWISDFNHHLRELVSYSLASLFASCLNFAVAFMIHVKKTSSKLRLFYLIPTVLFPLVFYINLNDMEADIHNKIIAYLLFLFFLVAVSTAVGLNNICSALNRPSVSDTLLFDENTISPSTDSNKNPHDL